MNKQHLLLLFFWIGYGVFHSFFANSAVKKVFEKLMGMAFIYYRPAYSFFAFFTLALLLWFQFSVKSILLFSSLIIRYGLSFIFILPGIITMAVCINKYFYDLSGIKVFIKKSPESISDSTLQQNGLHKFVRHPLYTGTLLFVWGLFFMFPFLSNLIAAVVMNLYVIVGIRLEEKKLFLEYGEAYKQYSKKVPRLIPFLRYQ